MARECGCRNSRCRFSTSCSARPGDIVTREHLIARLWPKRIVEFDAGLNAAVRRLRAALGDEAETPRYIETVPRKGYRFIGTLRPPGIGERYRAPPLMPARPIAAAPMLEWRRVPVPAGFRAGRCNDYRRARCLRHQALARTDAANAGMQSRQSTSNCVALISSLSDGRPAISLGRSSSTSGRRASIRRRPAHGRASRACTGSRSRRVSRLARSVCRKCGPRRRRRSIWILGWPRRICAWPPIWRPRETLPRARQHRAKAAALQPNDPLLLGHARRRGG